MLVTSNRVVRKVKAAFFGAAAVLVVGLGATAADAFPDQPLLVALVATAVPVLAAYFTKASAVDGADVTPEV